MEVIQQITELIKNSLLKDVIIPGYIDNTSQSNVSTFHPVLHSAYLQFEPYYLRLQTPDRWSLHLTIVPEIECDFECDVDDTFALCLVSTLYFGEWGEHGPQRVDGLGLYLDHTSSLSQGIVRWGGIHVHSGQTLYFDPANTYGIQLGTYEALAGEIQLSRNDTRPYERYDWKRS